MVGTARYDQTWSWPSPVETVVVTEPFGQPPPLPETVKLPAHGLNDGTKQAFATLIVKL